MNGKNGLVTVDGKKTVFREIGIPRIVGPRDLSKNQKTKEQLHPANLFNTPSNLTYPGDSDGIKDLIILWLLPEKA